MMRRPIPAWIFCCVALQAQIEDRFFSATLYPVFQEKNCRACHVENGVASATRLRFPSETASVEEVEHFGKQLAVLGPLLLNKPTNRVEHTGGKLIPPGSKEESLLIRWVNHLATVTVPPPLPAAEKPKAPAVMRRLTHSQYNNTVKDLLGDQTLPANQFPQEDFVNGFKNQVESQSVSPVLAEAYSTAAERLARNAFRGGDTNNLLPCRPSSPDDATCRSKFIRSFGLKAFRRPLTEVEARRYGDLFAAEAKRGGDFVRGAQAVIEAMLQAPGFLYRLEEGPYQVASRLSYFLWDTMPDAELFRAAAAGELARPEQVEKQARRMLKDPRARLAVDEFISQWLRFDRLWSSVKDRRAYSEYTPELGVAMTEEARRLIADKVWNDGNFMEIFTAEYGFLNSDLAGLYQFPKPAEEFGLVPFPPDSDRAGILGQAAFLSLTSKPEETSPTARGLYIREQLLCQHVPSPPPGTNMNLPLLQESRPQTNQERLLEHLSNQSCKSCHQLIDPIGFGLEKFDGIGRRREKQSITFGPTRADRNRIPVTVQLAIEGKGIIAGIPNSAFTSPKELGAVLAASEQCQECVVRQLFRYAFGRHETPADRPAIQKAYQKFRDSQFRFKELMISLVTLGG